MTEEAIGQFRGKYAFLSNFAPSPITIWFAHAGDEVQFPTAEHAYQAHKTLDMVEVRHIASAPTPYVAKRRGREVRVRRDWEEVKFGIMLIVVHAKFEQNPHLAGKLLATGDVELIEGNNWGDTYWGVDNRGVGENNLGRILQLVRHTIRRRVGASKLL